MWTNKDHANFTPRGFPFSTPQPEKKRSSSSNMYSSPPFTMPPENNNSRNLFNVIHKVPAGDSPYVRAKHVQLVDKNPGKAVSMFWAAINSGDRVDSALKDMAVVMKQLNRSEEAIEAIKSFRHLCPLEAQESLDNILLELYKRSGRIEEQIELLQSKLKHMEDVSSLSGNRMKLARSQGKKIQITMGQEYSRLLGNLAWAHLQQDDYKLAEEIYRKALSMEPDKNKRCNLAICLMYMDKMTEAKFLLSTVKDSNRTDEESYAKSYERAIQVMDALESEKTKMPFSLFLNRFKDSDSVDDGKRGKCKDLEGDLGRLYVSPGRIGGTPRVLFTQPRVADGGDRRRDRERADFSGGCSRKLRFDQNPESKMTTTPSSELQFSKTNGCLHGNVRVDVGKCKKSWADMAEEDEEQIVLEPSGGTDRKRADSGEGYFQKLHFEQPVEVKSTKTPFINGEMSNIPSSGNEKVTMEAGESKKSWADMAEEEDEQILLESATKCWKNKEEYGDENVDYNIMCKKIESLSVHEGYRTQPGTAKWRTNRSDNDENWWCSSPLKRKTLGSQH